MGIIHCLHVEQIVKTQVQNLSLISFKISIHNVLTISFNQYKVDFILKYIVSLVYILEIYDDIRGNFGKRAKGWGGGGGVGKMLNTCVNVNKGDRVPTSEFPYTYSYLLFIQFEKQISSAYQRKFWERGD